MRIIGRRLSQILADFFYGKSTDNHPASGGVPTAFMYATKTMYSKSMSANPPKFFIRTYGCQMNVYDSRMVASLFEMDGLEETDNPEDADIIIVNTCSV
ncbi:MAG: hypothetical protein U9R01_00200, partial [candidate division WOR-3 bacterium]|nr:hypothetical protein [candidate division WOR-3 bacterium]